MGAANVVNDLAGLGFKRADIQSITGFNDRQMRRLSSGEYLTPLEDRHAISNFMGFIRNARKYVQKMQEGSTYAKNV